MTHLGYVLGAYAVAAAVMLALVAWVTIDHRVQKKRLARLEAERAQRGAPGRLT